jgi:hypothetical protein
MLKSQTPDSPAEKFDVLIVNLIDCIPRCRRRWKPPRVVNFPVSYVQRLDLRGKALILENGSEEAMEGFEGVLVVLSEITPGTVDLGDCDVVKTLGHL